jgi:hypothetical protein
MKKVKVRIPLYPGVKPVPQFVSVNNYTCIIKRGEEVEVPLFVKAVLDHQEKMQERIEQFEAGAVRG